MLARTLVTLTLTLLAVPALVGADPPRGPILAAEGLAFSIDLDAARSIGWVAPDEDDAAARGRLAAFVRRRLGALAGEREVRVELDGADLLVVPGAGWSGDERALVADALEGWGVLEFRILATPADGIPLELERERLAAWLRAHPDRPVAAHRLVAPEAGGPDPRLTWALRAEGAEGATAAAGALPLLVPERLADDFGLGAVERLYRSQDTQGYPALGFELRDGRQQGFGDFTEWNQKRQMAIVLGGVVGSAPIIENRLPGGGIVQGRYTEEAFAELFASLRDRSAAVFRRLER